MPSHNNLLYACTFAAARLGVRGVDGSSHIGSATGSHISIRVEDGTLPAQAPRALQRTCRWCRVVSGINAVVDTNIDMLVRAPGSLVACSPCAAERTLQYSSEDSARISG
jgi:hypothetical protein